MINSYNCTYLNNSMIIYAFKGFPKFCKLRNNCFTKAPLWADGTLDSKLEFWFWEVVLESSNLEFKRSASSSCSKQLILIFWALIDLSISRIVRRNVYTVILLERNGYFSNSYMHYWFYLSSYWFDLTVFRSCLYWSSFFSKLTRSSLLSDDLVCNSFNWFFNSSCNEFLIESNDLGSTSSASKHDLISSNFTVHNDKRVRLNVINKFQNLQWSVDSNNVETASKRERKSLSAFTASVFKSSIIAEVSAISIIFHWYSWSSKYDTSFNANLDLSWKIISSSISSKWNEVYIKTNIRNDKVMLILLLLPIQVHPLCQNK